MNALKRTGQCLLAAALVSALATDSLAGTCITNKRKMVDGLIDQVRVACRHHLKSSTVAVFGGWNTESLSVDLVSGPAGVGASVQGFDLFGNVYAACQKSDFVPGGDPQGVDCSVVYFYQGTVSFAEG